MLLAHRLTSLQRPTPGNGYLECITDDEKCVVNFEGIKEITERGIVTNDGVEHELDVLVCATGFDVSFRPRYPIVGTAGDMADVWKETPETYLSVTAPKFPNYFSGSTRIHDGKDADSHPSD